MNLQDLKATISRLKATTPEVMRKQILESLKRNEQVAISHITDQLWSGELGDGSKMPDYSDRSVQVFNKPAGPWRLYNEGDYYKGIFMKAARFPVMFDNRDSKTGKIADMLASKGGNPDEIMTMNTTNKNDLARNHILPDLQSFVRSLIRIR